MGSVDLLLAVFGMNVSLATEIELCLVPNEVNIFDMLKHLTMSISQGSHSSRSNQQVKGCREKRNDVLSRGDGKHKLVYVSNCGDS